MFWGGDYGATVGEVVLFGLAGSRGGAFSAPFFGRLPDSGHVIGMMAHGDDLWLLALPDVNTPQALRTLVVGGSEFVDAAPPLPLMEWVRGVQAISETRILLQGSETLRVLDLGPTGWTQTGDAFPTGEAHAQAVRPNAPVPTVRAVSMEHGVVLVAQSSPLASYDFEASRQGQVRLMTFDDGRWDVVATLVMPRAAVE